MAITVSSLPILKKVADASVALILIRSYLLTNRAIFGGHINLAILMCTSFSDAANKTMVLV
jgi:hypothetical protein